MAVLGTLGTVEPGGTLQRIKSMMPWRLDGRYRYATCFSPRA